MKEKIVSVGHKNPDTDSILSAMLVSKFSKKIFGFESEAVRAGSINNETAYILNFVKIKKPRLLRKIAKQKVIVVDTTEPNQIVDGLTEDNLFAVIDHHNLGGLRSSKPIYSRVEPIGSTCSVIYKILREKNIRIDKTSSVLLMSAVISDTLNLKSPTATLEDRKIIRDLNKTAKLNIRKFSGDLFAAKSSLKGVSLKDIVDKDYKQFDMGGSKVGIGVFETTNPESLVSYKRKIMKLLSKKKREEKLDYILFAVVDIMKNNSYIYTPGDEEESLCRETFGVSSKDNITFLKKVVSRKKQIVPVLMDKLSK